MGDKVSAFELGVNRVGPRRSRSGCPRGGVRRRALCTSLCGHCQNRRTVGRGREVIDGAVSFICKVFVNA